MILSVCGQDKSSEIKQLFKLTFSDSEGESEGMLIANLVEDLMASRDQEDILCFKAIESNEIIACIFFSRLTFEYNVNAFLLSPVAVHTDHQGKGVGQALINFGLNALREKGVELVLTYGDINFYSKVGFKVIDEKVVKAPWELTYPEGWLGQALNGGEITQVPGNSFCVEAFNNPKYW